MSISVPILSCFAHPLFHFQHDTRSLHQVYQEYRGFGSIDRRLHRHVNTSHLPLFSMQTLTISSLEKRSAAQHFSEDTTNRPHINYRKISLVAKPCSLSLSNYLLALVYFWKLNIISGALYHRVAT